MKLTGPQMRKLLVNLGIPVQRVTRQRKTGEYIADFYIPLDSDEPIGREHAVLPTQTYVSMLKEKLPTAEVTNTGEWETTWRENPDDVIRYEAFVAFTIPANHPG